jgi:hypothetical protein
MLTVLLIVLAVSIISEGCGKSSGNDLVMPAGTNGTGQSTGTGTNTGISTGTGSGTNTGIPTGTATSTGTGTTDTGTTPPGTNRYYPEDHAYWTGYVDSTYTKYEGTITVTNEYYPTKKGWVKFNIAGLPDGSTITKATAFIHIACIRDGSGDTQVDVLSIDPVTASGSDIYSNYGGAAYSGLLSINDGWLAVELQASALASLQSTLDLDWFALKFHRC